MKRMGCKVMKSACLYGNSDGGECGVESQSVEDEARSGDVTAAAVYSNA